MTHTQPHSSEAEVSVLGAILLDNDALGAVGELDPLAFYEQRHRLIFGAIRALAAKGAPLDTITLFDALAAQGHVDRAGGPAYLARLAEAVPTAAHAAHYARIVREKAKLRG